MGRPRTGRKDLPPGLYWDERRGFFYRARGKFVHIGKVSDLAARKAWVKASGRREFDADPGTLAELLDAYEDRGLPLVPSERTRHEYARQLPILRKRWGHRRYAKTAAQAIDGTGYLLPLDFTLFLDPYRPKKDVQRVRGAVQARQDVRLVSSVFTWSIGRGMTLFNPVAGCLMISTPPRKVRLEEDTRNRIAAQVPPAVRLMIDLAALTGMRQTDLRLLTLNQIRGDTLFIGQSKTGTEQEWEITSALRAVLDAAAKLPARKRNTMIVFPSRKGTAYSESGLQSAWRRARVKADAQGYVFRDIRKRAINEARPRGDAPEFAGHQDPRTTAQHYYTDSVKVRPLK